LEFIASRAEAQNWLQRFVARVNSCPALTRWAWQNFGCSPGRGIRGSVDSIGCGWRSLVSESSGIWTCGWWLSPIGEDGTVNNLHGVGSTMNRKCISTQFSIDSHFRVYYSRAHSGCRHSAEIVPASLVGCATALRVSKIALGDLRILKVETTSLECAPCTGCSLRRYSCV
jgi:hypothetical protein